MGTTDLDNFRVVLQLLTYVHINIIHESNDLAIKRQRK